MFRATAICLILITGVRMNASAQEMLPGCRLEDGSLQCVPGLTASPEKQIEVLDGEINQGLQQESHLEQTIEGLKRFVLVGEAKEGSILKTDLTLQAADLDELSIHWYRRNARGNWKLMKSASGNSYRVGPNDREAWIMAVLVVRDRNGSIKRINSNTIGPIPN